jgi:hypothetical protein
MVSSHRQKRKAGAEKSKNRIGSMQKIINELYSPIDAVNRFINLALQSIGENPQGRQFLLESKEGIRKTSQLLKKLNNYAGQIEEEIRKMPDMSKRSRVEKGQKKAD